MKKLYIIIIFALAAIASCTKSKEIHPEIGNGNDEIVTVGMDNVHIKYIRNDIASLQKVLFHYSLADEQQFNTVEMIKHSDCFTLIINSLQSDTLYSYYYELFPHSGNAYQTTQKTFHTQTNEMPALPSYVPEGAINGLFTINENGDQVYFSQGNLQYQASTNTWRFADHQWDFVGGHESGGGGVSYQYDGGTVYENGVRCRNELISSTYDGWIDLFGWGTSGFNHGAICYQPWSISQESGDYFAYGNDAYSLYNMTGKADWGYNAIRNGGRINNVWRTLKSEEWDYILNNRYTVSGIKYAKATLVDFYEDEPSIMGLIIIPDDWSGSYYTLMYTNSSNSSFLDNRISKSDWENIFEANGAVFLPVAGLRFGVINSSIMESAYYWSSSSNESLEGYMATSLTFSDNSVFTGHFSYHSYCVISGNGVGEAVRLVHDANK